MSEDSSSPTNPTSPVICADTSAAHKQAPIPNAWKPINSVKNVPNGTLVQAPASPAPSVNESVEATSPVSKSEQDSAISEPASQNTNTSQGFAPVMSKRARKLQMLKQKSQQPIRPPVMPVRKPGPSPTKFPGFFSGHDQHRDEHTSENRVASSPKLLKVSNMPGLVPAPKPVVSAWAQIEPSTSDSFMSRPMSSESFMTRESFVSRPVSRSTPCSPKKDTIPSSSASATGSVTEYAGDNECGSANVTQRKGKKASWTTLPVPVGSVKTRPGFTAPASQRSNGPANVREGKNMTAVRTRNKKPDQMNHAGEPGNDAHQFVEAETSSKRGQRSQLHSKHRGPKSHTDDVHEPECDPNEDVSVQVVSTDSKPDSLVDQVESGIDMMSVSVDSTQNSPYHHKHRRPYYQHNPVPYHAYDDRRSYASRSNTRYAPPFTYMPQHTVYYPPPVMHVPYTGPAGPYVATVPAVDMESLQRKIVSQINYYFSVENLCHDLYLRTHMSASGWVELSVLASFNRVRVLTDSVPILQQCLTASKTVEMSPDMLSIRRRNDWQRWVLDPATAASLVSPLVATSTEAGLDAQPHAQSNQQPDQHAYLQEERPVYLPEQPTYMPVTTTPEGSAAGCLEMQMAGLRSDETKRFDLKTRVGNDAEPRCPKLVNNEALLSNDNEPNNADQCADLASTKPQLAQEIRAVKDTCSEKTLLMQECELVPCHKILEQIGNGTVQDLESATDFPRQEVECRNLPDARCGSWAIPPMIISTPYASILDDRFQL